MSYREYLDWIKYRNRYGTLHSGMRLDRTLANSSSFFANLMIGKKGAVKAVDFSPYDATEDEAASVDDVFNLLSAIAKKE